MWSYSLLRITPAIDRLVDKFYTEVVGPFWPIERKFVDDKYQSIRFPFEEYSTPSFYMEVRWNLNHLTGYLKTWSAVQRFKEEQKTDPVEVFAQDLVREWGRPEEEKRIRWPINMRVGRVH